MSQLKCLVFICCFTSYDKKQKSMIAAQARISQALSLLNTLTFLAEKVGGEH